MGCCGKATWKREEVPDHKFDFIDVRDYHSDSFLTRTRYGLLFALVIKSIAVYVADIYTAITLLALGHFSGNIYNQVQDSPDNTVKVPIVYGKWVFFGCILFSFLLLAYEAHRARAVVRSRDISYAYTNVMAYNHYSLRSYDHFCFFSQINNSKKKKDEFAFFIFFTFKGWKRLLVADGPRQVINALTLYALGERTHWSTNVSDYYDGNIFTAIMLLTMLFTVVVFAGSAILLAIAALMYLPLVCYIRGNLKEYCCHKIDKRITELVQKKKRQRLAKHAAIARAEAEGDFSHLMNKKGIIVGQKIIQPTLPKVDVDLLDEAGQKGGGGGGPPRSTTPLKRFNSLGSSTVHGGMGPGGDGAPFYDQSEVGSTVHLLSHPGAMAAGATGAVPPSMMGVGAGSAAPTDSYSPSLPPTAHNSPDSYPLQVRGGSASAGVGANSNVVRGPGLGHFLPDPNLMMAQLGPIGTSPDLFAKHVRGRQPPQGSTVAASSTTTNASSTLVGSEDGFGPSPSSASDTKGRSPLAPPDAPGAYVVTPASSISHRTVANPPPPPPPQAQSEYEEMMVDAGPGANNAGGPGFAYGANQYQPQQQPHHLQPPPAHGYGGYAASGGGAASGSGVHGYDNGYGEAGAASSYYGTEAPPYPGLGGGEGATPEDLSAYAPYHDDGGGAPVGMGGTTRRPSAATTSARGTSPVPSFSYSDVYDQYLHDDDPRGLGGGGGGGGGGGMARGGYRNSRGDEVGEAAARRPPTRGDTDDSYLYGAQGGAGEAWYGGNGGGGAAGFDGELAHAQQPQHYYPDYREAHVAVDAAGYAAPPPPPPPQPPQAEPGYATTYGQEGQQQQHYYDEQQQQQQHHHQQHQQQYQYSGGGYRY